MKKNSEEIEKCKDFNYYYNNYIAGEGLFSYARKRNPDAQFIKPLTIKKLDDYFNKIKEEDKAVKDMYSDVTEDTVREALKAMADRTKDEKVFIVHTAIGTYKTDGTGNITYFEFKQYMEKNQKETK